MAIQRKRFDPRSASAEGLAHLLRQQDRLNEKVNIPTSAGGGESFTGPIVPTVLVAASDARSDIRALADFKCDGVDDQDEIQAAVDVLSGGFGGRIVLTEGTFNIRNSTSNSTAVNMQIGGEYVLQGMGPGTRILFTNFSAGFFGQAFGLPVGGGKTVIRDMYVSFVAGSTANATMFGVGGSGRSTYENIVFDGADLVSFDPSSGNPAYIADGGYVFVSGCVFLELDDPDFYAFDPPVELSVVGCVFQGAGGQVLAPESTSNRMFVANLFTGTIELTANTGGDDEALIVAANHFAGGAAIRFAEGGCIVANNSWIDSTSGGTAMIFDRGAIIRAPIHIIGNYAPHWDIITDTGGVGNEVVIDGNFVRSIDLDTGEQLTVKGNQIKGGDTARAFGIRLTDVDESRVVDNIGSGRGQASSAFIEVTGTSTDTSVERNTYLGLEPGGTAPVHNYGLKVGASTSGVRAGWNDFRAATAHISDAAGIEHEGLEVFVFADSSDPLATGTGKQSLVMSGSGEIIDARAIVSTADQPTGASIIVDVNVDGSSLWALSTSQPTIAVSTDDSGLTVPDQNAVYADGAFVTVDIDQVGSTVPGSFLTVVLRVRRD